MEKASRMTSRSGERDHSADRRGHGPAGTGGVWTQEKAMRRYRGSYPLVALSMMALLHVLSDPVLGHERQVVGRFRLTIGWGEEPPFTGFKNFVMVGVSDATGAAVIDSGGSLAVEVSFGDQRIVLPLQPAAERKGEFRAWLVPTRAGTYTFHITGKLKNEIIDTKSTCSDSTFECVSDIAEVEFPTKDPSVGQLAERIGREVPRAERAIEKATTAQNVALTGIGIAVLALAAAIGLGLLHVRRNS